jgi:ABC-type glycerol-3-phosphate transport system permease component
MKSSVSAGAVSGCIVWALVFAALSTCIFPVVMAIGGITSSSSIAIQTTGNFICPEDTTAESYSYPTTSTDEYGNSHPATAYELHCVDASGNVVKEDPVSFAFLWIGILAVVGFIVAVVLAFAFAAPAGVLIARLLNRSRKGNQGSAYTPPS